MNAFITQHIRDKYHIEWQEEYILGMVNQIGSMSTTRILNLCDKQKLMSPATAHKYLKSTVRRKLVSQKRNKEDARGVEFTVAPKGEQFLEEVKHAHVRK